jgi:hypothetical protein
MTVRNELVKKPPWYMDFIHPSIQWLYTPNRALTSSVLRLLNLIKTLGRTPLDEWSARRKGLHLHRTIQHRNTKINIHAQSGIRTRDPSNQAALDRAATGSAYVNLLSKIRLDVLCKLTISTVRTFVQVWWTKSYFFNKLIGYYPWEISGSHGGKYEN